ncbi:MAG: T9SS type A sorting domain-containing protein [Chitinophagales bacterium]|nr:T9SS type A sorting domain-containing protein [Chitinophagales bacterium]
MKNIIITAILTLIVSLGFGQNKEILRNQADFTKAMQDYIAAELNDADKMKAAREQYGHSCVSGVTVSDDIIRKMAEDAARSSFIQSNLETYISLFFPEVSSRSVTADTFICDNGGFENDFLYYKGYVATYDEGSSTCTPYFSNLPVAWTPQSLPTLRRFEIVSPGTDALTGIQKVKFGNKALKLNDRLGHHIDLTYCYFYQDINKITKRFKVTEENRHFTVWYAAVFENPTNNPHVDQQPYLNIKCDLDPARELCYDAAFLMCDTTYTDAFCHLDPLDVIDWSCHSFKIPRSEVGNIATLEISMADCGQGGHRGYAYIDGICEPCNGSALGGIFLPDGVNIEGSIDYTTCEDSIVRICGYYELPTVCGIWDSIRISIPGYTIENLVIDKGEQTFCFDFPYESFGLDTCIEIYAEIVFKSSITEIPPQISNSIYICKDQISKFDFEVVEITDCYDNDTESILSDDYYYVKVFVDDRHYDGWTITRILDEPYPGESGGYTLKSGTGTKTIILGPFLIQEGCWDLIVTFPGCSYSENICPPEYCSGCGAFNGIKISNITCYPNKPAPDTWSFDIFVPGSGNYAINVDGTPYFGKTKGSVHTITVGNIEQRCIDLILNDGNSLCSKTMTICPPLPCSVGSCRIEAYIDSYVCDDEDLFVSFVLKGNTCLSGGSMIYTPIDSYDFIGPITASTSITFYDCNNPDCFKTVYVPMISCDDPNIGTPMGRPMIQETAGSIMVVPNPVDSDILTIRSDMDETTIIIVNTVGQILYSGMIFGREEILRFNQPPGIYYIKYKDAKEDFKYLKFIKM